MYQLDKKNDDHTRLVENDPRWQKVMSRDKSARDFVFAVQSTAIYCLACCPARRPNPENISFYNTPAEAEAAGYRACKRCKPDQADAGDKIRNLIEQACRRIELAEENIPLAELAKAAGLSPFYFQRQFKAITGLTPKLYARTERARRMREALTDKDSNVTQAIYDAGFQSSSRFYHHADDMLGMSPTAFKKGGKNMEIRFAVAECSLGSVLIGATSKGICAVTLGDDPEELVQNLQDRFPQAELFAGDKEFETHIAAVIAHIENPAQDFDLPLDIQGTIFQQKVWQALRDIPSGQTTSYSDLASRIGQPKASRAVAGACGANKIAVIIPCHRVVRNNGDLSGYRWGVERKRALLIKEQQKAQTKPD
ncbi:AraC family transcriptional regulator of adaptative response/methylated-DNA-[protein]-cysteine methyltransferase [Paenochrobactrum gallinarii]|uniref:AraC family transcriptional regulator of adaptative response/methylated-DNA-[protein]-cysteine methyltransferase n=1 Tax=Paenochrobactrum gallinarii TaxID=643673 RepID=A0A841LRB0_9HYPH|nr:bifunctional DNA-binding transcriptional regulator/O6-methylguanine-DNA methyltransferase Ada [Paenochrobactrum gallinarii]MBB6260603.1 AraC family transcriptional regulator of adaptative response/methylated-DNA-[protein]-cysteine methyltransferase [Paenochrobactrum gallinarii]